MQAVGTELTLDAEEFSLLESSSKVVDPTQKDHPAVAEEIRVAQLRMESDKTKAARKAAAAKGAGGADVSALEKQIKALTAKVEELTAEKSSSAKGGK